MFSRFITKEQLLRLDSTTARRMSSTAPETTTQYWSENNVFVGNSMGAALFSVKLSISPVEHNVEIMKTGMQALYCLALS